ncbi:MAG: aspartate kinase [SAR324 cluster bacterium]|nr:aspartate kinase [SAR324 cluster bacterium]
MSLIVQKYGGTSLGNSERLLGVANIIKDTANSHSVIVVVSALSSYTKSEGTTSRLIEAGNASIARKDYSQKLGLIEKVHFDIIENTIQSKELRQKISTDIHEELQHLKSFLEAIQVIQEISPRSQDLIVGTGERLSAQLLAGILQDQGMDGIYTNLSEIAPLGVQSTDPKFSNKLQKMIEEALPIGKGVIPVVTGFFGFVTGGIIRGVGRGYTDYTAALISGKLKAEELQIWKEVDGIFTADPNKVPGAHVLDYIFPNEAAELTYFGSEVLHPFTMECTTAAKVPVRIKNTFAPQKPGTVIIPKKELPSSAPQRSSDKKATAVTTKNKISVININSNRMMHSPGFLAKVFDIFRRHGIVIDLISTSEVNISCSVDTPNDLTDLKKEFEQLGKVTIIPDRAILSLVGDNMKHVPGVAGKMFSALAENEINLEMITQGASEINISCVIKQKDAQKALKVIHQTFLE